MGQELNVYASSGISDDHECVNAQEMIERLRVGIKVFIREGSSERNVDKLVKGIVEHHLRTDNIMFCTDDKHAREIQQEGHINCNAARAIALGLDPMDALQMATVNAAKHFRLEGEIGSITPGRLADILLVDDLRELKSSVVLFEGQVMARDGKLLRECPVSAYPDWIKHTVTLKRPITAESFRIPAPQADGSVKVHVIDMIPRRIINRRATEEMAVRDGCIGFDPDRDLLKLAVVERYGKNGNVGLGIVRGFRLQKGAMAYSMSHDHHNIVVVGVNDGDMAAAVNEVARLNGGLCAVCDGKVLGSMELPTGGLMSEKPADEVMEQLDVLNRDARRLGCEMDAPFMSLSFASLPTVPDLGLTDKGLADVPAHELIPLVQAD